MLHEPEFESPETDASAEQAAPVSRSRKIVRGVLYASLLGVFGLAVGIQASPKLAAAVGRNVPEPVAAMMASFDSDASGSTCSTDRCCSSMSRASLMAASQETGSCCSAESSGACPLGSCPSSDSVATEAEVAVALPEPEEVAIDEAPVAVEVISEETVVAEPVEQTEI